MQGFSQAFWGWIDRMWVRMASVKLTFVIFFGLLLLSIPGTVILQQNISNVDPGIQYDYDFWKFGQITQLFTAYHSFWYTGLIVILAMNLIACSVQRWPQMFRLAKARPVARSKAAFLKEPEQFRHEWNTPLGKEAAKEKILQTLKSRRTRPLITEDSATQFQVAWSTGRWSRLANVLVHMSLLVVFAGAILTSMYGFEGGANIPSGGAVDTLLIFKEGKASGLKPAPGGLPNERLLGFRLQCEDFNVKFYDNFPGRPKAFISKLNVIENGKVAASKTIQVNDPLEYKNFVFYQASYGRLGDFDIHMRVIGKKDPQHNNWMMSSHLGEPHKLEKFHKTIVPTLALENLQGLGPAVQFQELEGQKPTGEPFWVLQNYPEFDIRRNADYVVVVDRAKELFFTGLQIAYDPGAPIYWLGCFGMLIGTFYALFVRHKRYYLRFENGTINFAGTIHRIPTGFEKNVSTWAERLKLATTQSVTPGRATTGGKV
jgi:cytochrome c biogenesis protein